MRKIFGFTLSELIVAMGIIGIIVAVTVPAVVQRYQKNMQVTMLKKVYNNLQDALLNMQTENIGQDSDNSLIGSISPDVERFFDDYFIVNSKCGHNPVPCFATSYRSIENNASENTDFYLTNDSYCVLLNDGASMCIVPAHIAQVTGPQEPRVYVDVNGPDKPNIGGRDMFVMEINQSDYSIDVVSGHHLNSSTIEEFRQTLFNSVCLNDVYGTGCFGKILNDDWKMNY